MAIFFNKVQRVNPRNPKGDRKWYPVIKSIGKVDEHDVAKMLAENQVVTKSIG